jgi:histidine triad (HIT) family protein
MSDCIFCKIAMRQIPALVVKDSQDVLAFRDIQPQAPVHILIVPKKHYSSVNDFAEADKGLIGQMVLTAQEVAKQEKLADRGYRLVWNCGNDGGQSVGHVHLHLLGGRQLSWPPG